MGESTSIETVSALVYNKPIVLLRQPNNFSGAVSGAVRGLVERYEDVFVIEPLDRLTAPELTSRLGTLAASQVEYGLSTREKETVMFEALALTRKYRASWEDYCSRGLNYKIASSEGLAG